MDHYRNLNREMVQEIQTMRLNIRMYCDEIVSLRAKLMEYRETEINLRKLLYQSIIGNCLQLTEIVKPDSDILPLLREAIVEKDIYSSQPQVVERSTNTLRRSTLITAELRRSNSIINIRNSMRSISPIRRRSSSNSVEEENACEVVGNTDEGNFEENDNNHQWKEGNGANKHPAATDKQTVSYNVINEESEEDSDGFEWPQHTISSESEQEPCETFRNVTDMSDNSETQNKENKIIKGQKQKKQPKLDNSSEPCKKVDNSKKQNKSRKKLGRKLKSKTRKTSDDSSASEVDDESVQVLRRSVRRRELKTTDKSIPIVQNNNLSDEVTINSLDFFEALSSTPNTKRKPATTNSETESATMSIASSRPSRQCRPKVLVEPSTRTKLRNETSTSLTRTKKKK